MSRLEQWLCDKCTPAPPTPAPSTASTLDDAVETSQPFKGINRDTLKVLHWNADGLSTKWPELNECLKKADIDIALIQETKYKNNTKLPAFPGYAPIRYDRDGGGGGLLCLIKHNIPLYIPKYCKQTVGGVESISFRVRLDKKKWICFTNVYMAPRREGGKEIIYTDHIPASGLCFIAGDVNGHSVLWDNRQPPDSRGERIEEWLADCNMHCVNDGSPTRTNRAPGSHSTPDVFLAPSQWLNQVGWTTLEDIGGSDHLPGMATIHCKWKSVAPLQRLARWKKNADLSSFSKVLEEKVKSLKQQKTIDRIKEFHETVLAAAIETVPKTTPGKNHVLPLR